ncbi:MAG: histidinol dehydrogenase [Flammeovirgaceae bacterium]
MQLIQFPHKKDWQGLLLRPTMDLSTIETQVRPILEAVRNTGDEAVRQFSEQFDKVKLSSWLVSEEEIDEANQQVSDELKESIGVAKSNIEKFHQLQLEIFPKVETINGVSCWRKSVPIQKVGLYIPGGTAPLFSTVLMLGVPAQLAGCPEIILCTPPNKEGKVHPAILYTANLVGIKRIFKIGGAQAIAAMTFGTQTIPAVYKIFGPGNQYVTAAKQLAVKEGIAIDMPAGPSEVAVLADETANPVFVAADLLSQAEHGADSQVLLVSNKLEIIQKTQEEVQKQLTFLPRKELAAQALKNSKAILVKDLNEGLEMMNEYAPEHLILAVREPEKWAEKVSNAGSVFLGHLTPESAGDYASGTNHTLPTNGYAKNYSGVSLDSFFKKITFQHISPEGLKNLGKHIERMAAAEELDAHKMAVTYRLKTL